MREVEQLTQEIEELDVREARVRAEKEAILQGVDPLDLMAAQKARRERFQKEALKEQENPHSDAMAKF